ncbi:unnamed protein product [Symbiodinium natans]|uniref:BTB domain-containing protein n=1 Tax=Symbiodinium natans TaxID=878477 RepID=A0A812R063_9DINO|nr:unnamed protein product [Symbiodinium natans]
MFVGLLPALPGKDVPRGNPQLRELKEERRADLVYEVIDVLRAEGGLRLGLAHFTAGMSACAAGKLWQSALSLFALLPDCHLEPDLILYNATMSSLEKGRQWQRALGLFLEIPNAKLAPDVFSYGAAIGCCEKGEQWQLALALFTALPRTTAPNVISYSSTISALEKASRWELAVSLFNDMPRAKIVPNVVSYSVAINACGTGGQWQLALSHFEAMAQTKVLPNVISFSAAIRASDMAGQWQMALQLFASMPNSSVRADRIIFSAVICACDKGGQWQLALQLFSEMQDAKLPTDATSCNAAISACGMNAQWQPALALFSSMTTLKVAPNLIAYNAAISSCEKAGQWLLALHLLREMASSQVSPDVISYTAGIGACEKAGHWRVAVSVFQSLQQQRLEPTVISYSAIISACQKAGQWQLALHLFSEMPAVGLSPNVISYNATISACERAGRWQLALYLFGVMPRAHISPSTSSFNTALSACGKGQQWLLALRLFNSMPEAHTTPSVVSFNALLDALQDRPMGRAMFLRAREAGLYSCLCIDSPFTLDLHELSYGPTVHAVAWWFMEVLEPILSPTETQTCIIITGWGKTRPSWSATNLQAFVLDLLKQWGLSAAVQKSNRGRVQMDLRQGFLSVYNRPVDCYAAWKAYGKEAVDRDVDDSFAEFTRDVLGRCWGEGDFKVVVEEPGGEMSEGNAEAGLARKEFRVLSAVLGTASPVFEQMVKQGHFLEGTEAQVTITDFSSAAVEAFLLFLHFGSVDGSLATVLELGVLADKYAVGRLHRLCTSTVLDELMPWTACVIFDLADRFHNVDLRNHSLTLILTEPIDSLKQRPCLSPKLVEEIVASDALCIGGDHLQELVTGWDAASTEEDKEVQRLFEAYAAAGARSHRREATGDALFELKERYWGEGRQVAVLLGPRDKDWSHALGEPGFLEALAHNDNFHTYSILIEECWIVWMMPFVSLYLTGFSFNRKILTDEVHFKVFCSQDGQKWHLCLDSSEHSNIEEDENVFCDHRHVKWLKLHVLSGSFYTDFCVSGVVMQPLTPGF